MELSFKTFTFFNTPKPIFPPISSPFLKSLISFSSTPNSTHRLKLADSLQAETLQILEWPSLCNQLSAFTSTTMAFSAARTARIPLGTTPDESRKLLAQTTAAVAVPHPVDFSGVQDVMEILESAVSGQLLSIGEICAVKKTLVSAKGLFQQLKDISLNSNDLNRYSPLLEILQDCNFLPELEQKIGFCIDCKFSMILDRASEELEIIRSERKENMENLESLLKEVSVKIFQAGGIDRPLVTRRRSRLCVAVMANRRSLLSDGVVLSYSSSGATYFMEPKEAVELNNMEVKLSDAENAEVQAILSFLSSEIAESITEIKYLLDRIVDVDFAFARAAHSRWINGVCPTLNYDRAKDSKSNAAESLSIDIEGIQHPLLLETSLRSLSEFAVSSPRSPIPWHEENGTMDANLFSGAPTFPVPIDVKVKYGTRVVVISGPNTGGKTASMKTLGLASVMLKAGMYIPARNHPTLPWFDLILADIGDHQSLEQSLSTFSGHLSRIRDILEVASQKSLVLMDEIGSGTDPSEGVALSTSILQYLKDKVNLAVVTTHYADLSLLKEKDTRFENAAMEFSLETLRPTYRVLWGSTGESNALSIAKSIGFDENIVERAKIWVGRLMPEKAEKRRGFLYESLVEERDRLEEQANVAASLYSDTKNIYMEILDAADDLPGREEALKAKETERIQKEVNAVKSQIATVVEEFEKRIQTASANQINILLKESGSAIASIVGAHLPTGDLAIRQANSRSYTPKVGDQVHVNGLGNKLATIVDTPGGDYVFVQLANDRFRVELSSIRAPRSSSKSTTTGSSPSFRMQSFLNAGFQQFLGKLEMFVTETDRRANIFLAAFSYQHHTKMLAVFEKARANPPQELSLPLGGMQSLKTGEEVAKTFWSSRPDSTLYKLSDGNFMSLSHQDEIATHPRSIVVMDNIFCIFTGYLHDTCELRRHYGLSRQATEAMVMVEAYKVLRDRAPYPADQVIKELDGKFAFILYDAKVAKLFLARDRDGSMQLHWGVTADGSLVCSDDSNIISEAYGHRYSPFPPGCFFMSDNGLISFDHPLNKVRAIIREDDDGKSCAVIFQVDLFTRLQSIPRTGSAANWAGVTTAEGE